MQQSHLNPQVKQEFSSYPVLGLGMVSSNIPLLGANSKQRLASSAHLLSSNEELK